MKPQETMSAETVRTITVPAGAACITVLPDDCLGITDSAYNDLFGGDAAKGVAELVAAKAIAVNGTILDGEDVFINGEKALWKNENNTWSWKTHIMFHGENLSYKEASVAFVHGLSMLRGPSYTLTFADRQVCAIDFKICDACFAETVSIGKEFTTITVCGSGDGSMNRTNPSTIRFSNALVEGDRDGRMPADQCLVLYWCDEAGWHLKRANSSPITLPADKEQIFSSLLNLEYSEPWHRPTQPVLAFDMIELNRTEAIQWFFRDGITSGISHVDARSILLAAITKAENALVSTAVSAVRDGSDVDSSKPWVTQEYHDAFARVISNAKTVYAAEGLLNSKYEEALYDLCLAYGGDGSFYSKNRNAFADGIGFVPFAKSHTSCQK